MDREKHVDESWKESVEKEKDLKGDGPQPKEGKKIIINDDPLEQETPAVPGEEISEMEINFLNYITSLAFQAMIFLGEVPNPMTDNKVEQNLPQAKLLIDTLMMLREKTKGNLTKQEDDLLTAATYELQTRYVDALPKAANEQK